MEDIGGMSHTLLAKPVADAFRTMMKIEIVGFLLAMAAALFEALI